MIVNVFGVPVAFSHCVVISYSVIMPLGFFGGDHETSRLARLVASTRTASGGPGSKKTNQIAIINFVINSYFLDSCG